MKPAGPFTRAMAAALAAAAAVQACSGLGGAAGWQDSHSPDQILQAGIEARQQLHSFRVTVSGIDESTGKPVTFDMSLDGKGDVKGAFGGPISGTQTSFQLVVANGHTYIKGKQFWTLAAGAEAGAKLGDRWIDVTATGAAAAPFTSFSDVSTVRDCLFTGPHGTLSKHSTSSVDGYQAVEIDDKGDKPGTQPTKFYIDVDSPHYLVRYQSSGTPRPGGPPEPSKCNFSGSSSSSSSNNNKAANLDVHDINSVPQIQAPAGAVDIRTAAAGG